MSTQEHYQFVRDRLGRFAKVKRARCVVGEGVDDEALEVAQDWRDQLVELDDVLELWESTARADNPGLADWIRQERRDLRVYQERLARIETRRLAGDYQAAAGDPLNEWVDSREIDGADLASMDGRDRARLALKLAAWNGRGPVYVKREGKTHLHPRIRVLDLADPLVAAQPWADDVRAAVLEAGDPITPDRVVSNHKRRQAA